MRAQTAAARNAGHRPRLGTLTSSLLDHLKIPRPGREAKQGKITPSSKVYIGASKYEKQGKGSKSSKSHRSARSVRTSTRRDSSQQRTGADEGDLALALSPNGAPSLDAKPPAQTPLRHANTRKARFKLAARELTKEAAASGASAPQDFLANFIYGNSNDNDNEDDDDDDLDEEEDDEVEFLRPLMSEGEDEVAYFSNRIGVSEFKVRRRYTLHPHGHIRAGWDVFQLVLMTWILIVVPVELCFTEISLANRRGILQADLFVDAMFTIDILLNFITAIERDGKLHFSTRSIIRHYIRHNFAVDLIWTFPFYALFEHEDPFVYTKQSSATTALFQFATANPWLYPFSRCVRLLRVVGLPRILSRLEFAVLIPSKVSSLGSFAYVVLALSHVFSCVFAYLAFSDDDQLALAVDTRVLQDTDLKTKYVASFYWAIMTMTTVGYGDITVKTNVGRLFSLCAMAVGAGVFAYGITNVVSLFQQLYIQETEHRHKMDQVNSFMQNRGFSRKLRDEVRANVFNWRKSTHENKEQDREIFLQMARPIRAKVADLFCEQTMPRRMPFLAGCNSEFIHDLYFAMQVKMYLPGEDIIRQGDYGSEMYFLFVGHAQAFVGLTPVATFGPNSFFGEFSVINPKKARFATIQAMDYCEAHCVDRQTILSIFIQHPNALRSVQQLVTLRSRKALALLFESGGKSRTLLQGLAVTWRVEGVQGVLPANVSAEDVPILQELLPGVLSAIGAAASRRRLSASVPIRPDQHTPTVATRFQPSSPKAVDSSAISRPARRSMSLERQDPRVIMASLNALRAEQLIARTNGAASGDSKPPPGMGEDQTDTAKLMRKIYSLDPTDLSTTRLIKKRHSNPPVDRIPPTISENIDAKIQSEILSRLHELSRQQSVLDERMAEILALISSEHQDHNRLNGQLRLNHMLPPLVRDRVHVYDREKAATDDNGNIHQ